MHLCLGMTELTRQEPLNAEHLAVTQRRALIAQSGLSANWKHLFSLVHSLLKTRAPFVSN